LGTLVPEVVRLTPESEAQGEIAMICRDGLKQVSLPPHNQPERREVSSESRAVGST